MSYVLNSQLDLFSFLICAILLFDIYQRHEKHHLDDNLFLALLISNMLILLIDALSWAIDGRSIRLLTEINVCSNYIYFIMNPILPFLWILYTDYQIYKEKQRIYKLFWPYLIPLILNTIMVASNVFNQALFYIDQNNVYHRGPWFPVFLLLVFSYLIYAFILIIVKRKIIGKRRFLPLFIFSLPPIIGGIIQARFYGVALIWSGITLSLLIIYIYVQNHQLDTDYLTGIYNRKQLDHYLERKIDDIEVGQKFSAIMIDIDGFKKINDQYGHITGDEALEITADILKGSLRRHDFLARYGGDEFMIILDIANIVSLQNTVNRIKQNFSLFNLSGEKSYELTVSMGYDIYDFYSHMNAGQFIQRVDDLMYANKNKK